MHLASANFSWIVLVVCSKPLIYSMIDLQVLSLPTESQAGGEDTTVELPLSTSSLISPVLHCYYEPMIQNVDIVPVYLDVWGPKSDEFFSLS